MSVDDTLNEFERCWPWLAAALQRSGRPTHNKEDLWRLIAAKRALLWPGESCVLVSEFINYPNYRAVNGWLAGGDLRELKEIIVPRAEEFSRQNGCKRVFVTARRGWLRVLDGYHEHATRIAKDLD